MLKSLILVTIFGLAAGPLLAVAQPGSRETAAAIAALKAIRNSIPAGKPVIVAKEASNRNLKIARSVGWPLLHPRAALKCPASIDLSECVVPPGRVALDIVTIVVDDTTARVDITVLSPADPREVGQKLSYELWSVHLSYSDGSWCIKRILPPAIS